jgi:hypothetical protein
MKHKKNFDFEMAKELNLTIENEHSDYDTETNLAKNYMKKLKKGKFNFNLAQKGVENLALTLKRMRK